MPDSERTNPFELIVLEPVLPPGSPGRLPHAAGGELAAAACRGGGTGVLDLEWSGGAAASAVAVESMRRLIERVPASASIGVRLTPAGVDQFAEVFAALGDRTAVVILTGPADAGLVASLEGPHRSRRVLVEVRSNDDWARVTGPDAPRCGVIACGNESGGIVGDETTFVLLQRLLAQSGGLDVYARGGLGVHAAAGCRAVGARGVVLDDQVLLMPESPLPAHWQGMLDGLGAHETTAVTAAGLSCRVIDRPIFGGLTALRSLVRGMEERGEEAPAEWRRAIAAHVGWLDPDVAAWPVGQGIGVAARSRRAYLTTSRLVSGWARETARLIEVAHRVAPLAPASPLAQAHGTELPIVQGPMTRVSDVPGFAGAVARAGGLPLVALALLTGKDARPLLDATSRELAGRPWGVGVLGFVSPDLKREQLEEIARVRPPFALISGGRPDEALPLEGLGIATYLHTPVPSLLRRFLAEGARRFVFEGRECGGHVGPLGSFALWDAMIAELLDWSDAHGAADVHVLFAGGVHDARSAAIVAAMAAPLAERGARCGVLMGTAYLFTEEAVEAGAITTRYQQEAVACEDTILLVSGPGHANRVADTPFTRALLDRRLELMRIGVPSNEIRDELERLTLGRLRLASKGLVRDADQGLRAVPDAEQLAGGIFLMGQLAMLRSSVCTMRDLHDDVSRGATAIIAAARPQPQPVGEDPVAIIGLATLLPGAQLPETLWRRLLDQVNVIREVPPERWDVRLLFDADRDARDGLYARVGGFCDGIPFSPLAHRIPPAVMPNVCAHQLLALEVTRWAMADAGYERRDFDRENTAVITGIGESGGMLGNSLITRTMLPFVAGDVAPEALDRLPEWTSESFAGLLGNVTAGRVANGLDLGGANFCVDAACATSLLALHLAAQEIREGRATMAIAAGVDTMNTPFGFMAFARTQALSPTGEARVFDKTADGIVVGEGVVVAVLKSLSAARRDGDRVWAVLRGSGASSDGRGLSLTAPKAEGQTRAIGRALAAAGIGADTLGLYEAHGTGTSLGDRTEVETLAGVLDAAGARARSCVLGSLKSLVGHTKAAAGLAGVAKASLALRHRVLPPHAGVTQPLDVLTDPATPLALLDRPRPWLRTARHPRRAGINAFGFGGTNAAAIVEEYSEGDGGPDAALGADAWPAELFVFSGRTDAELAASIDSIHDALAAGAEPRVRDLAFSLALAADRAPAGPRAAVVAATLAELREALAIARRLARGETVSCPPHVHVATGRSGVPMTGPLAFLFPGQGSQSPGMALEHALYFQELRDALELANDTVAAGDDRPLSDLIFPPAAFSAADKEQQRLDLAGTQRAQPAIGAISIGIAALLNRLGLQAGVLGGHSYGELVALHASGALSARELLRLSEARGQAMASCCEGGTMLAAHASPRRVQELLAGRGGEVVVANHNAPEQVVLSGSTRGIEAARDALGAAGIRTAPLAVAGAFHSPLMAPAIERWRASLAAAGVTAPRTPVFSNSGDAVYASDPGAVRNALATQLLRPVEFVNQINAMYASGARVFIEAGPGSVLTRLTSSILEGRPHLAVAADPAGGKLSGLLGSLAALAVAGVPVRLARLFDARDVAPLALDRLADTRPGPLPATTWWVDGSRPRRLGDTDMPGAGAASLLTVDTKPAARETPAPAPAPSFVTPVAQATVGHDAAVEAFAAYQQTMRRFLDLQEQALSSFLAMAGGAPLTAARPSLAPVAAPPPREPLPVQETPIAGAAEPDAIARTVSDAREHSPAPFAADRVRPLVLRVFASHTGYPEEMLGLDLDLSGDLGVDSIRQVQALGDIGDGLPAHVRASVTAAADELLRLRTLGDIIARLTGLVDGSPGAVTKAAPCPAFLPVESPCPLPNGRVADIDGLVLITEDELGVARAVGARLAAAGVPAAIVTRADAATPDALRARIASLPSGRVGGLVHLAPLSRAGMPSHLDAWRARTQVESKSLFQILSLLASRDPAAGDGLRIVAASLFGGRYGRDGRPGPGSPAGAGAVGLLRSLVREWPGTHARAVDFADDDPARLADRILAELASPGGEIEVGYDGDTRLAFTTSDTAATLPETDPALEPKAGWVVLATGGARGVTAEALHALARPGVTFVIAGRAAEPEPEPAELAGLDVDHLRRHFVAASNPPSTPARIEARVQAVMRAREMRRVRETLEAAGATVTYRACDARDAAAVEALVAHVWTTHGRLDAVVHGAGVIEDALLARKDWASFDRVFDTKVDGLFLLDRALRGRDVRLFVLFSSVVSRAGNEGQTDYAAANDVLNRMAWRMAAERPSAKVVSIAWGPWASSGMATPVVRARLLERGIQPIETAAGRARLAIELRSARRADVEIVAGVGPWHERVTSPAPRAEDAAPAPVADSES